MRHFRLALSLFVAGVGGGLTGDGPDAWAQVPATPGAAGAQTGPVVVKVEGEVATPLGLTATELAQLPRQSVTAKAHDGKESRYEGVALIEILKKAGLPTGTDLRGKAVALYMVVEAADGYRAGLCPAGARFDFHRQSDPLGRPPRRTGPLVARGSSPDRCSR